MEPFRARYARKWLAFSIRSWVLLSQTDSPSSNLKFLLSGLYTRAFPWGSWSSHRPLLLSSPFPSTCASTTTNSTSKRGKRNVSSSKVSLRNKDSLEQHTWHLLEQRVGRLRDPSRSPAAEGKKSWICWLEYRTRRVMAQKVARACETVVLIELNFNCFFTHPSIADPASLATNGE